MSLKQIIPKKDKDTQEKPGIFSTFTQRLLIHIGALCGAIFIISPDWFSCLGIYLGIICLFQKQEANDHTYIYSISTGILQFITLLILGKSLSLSIFFGGLQTWMQRLIQGKAKTIDYLPAPFLIIVTCLHVESLISQTNNIFYLDILSFPIFLILGFLFQTIYYRIKIASLHKEMLTQALKRIYLLNTNNSFDDESKKQIDIMLSQSFALESAQLHINPNGRELIREINLTSYELEKHTLPIEKPNDWQTQIFGNLLNKKINKENNTIPINETLKLCNNKIINALKTIPNNDTNNLQFDNLIYLENQARQLLSRTKQVPEKIAPKIESIALSSFEIIKNMREDIRDRINGERFLKRYLSATDHIIDEYIRLINTNSQSEEIKQTIARAEEVLDRLQNAFKEENNAMLQNDSSTFTAELNALDKLLKMGGH